MRKIDKGNPVKSFSDFVRKNKPRLWEKLPGDIRSESTLAILQQEQHGLSGYTEKRLRNDCKNLHIDHFRKRSLFNSPEVVFDWENLVVDEHSPYYGADYKDNDKINSVKSCLDYKKIVDPVHDNPHEYFAYMTDGEIVPNVGLGNVACEKALFTIRVFNLNHPSLKDSRAEVIRQIVSLKPYYEADFIADCLEDSPFQSVVEYFCSPEIFKSLS